MLWEFCPLMTRPRISPTVKMETLMSSIQQELVFEPAIESRFLLSASCSCQRVALFRECFWAHVTSVTSFGMVTGITPNELCYCNVSEETGFLSFDVAVILDMIKVDHWEASNDTDKK